MCNITLLFIYWSENISLRIYINKLIGKKELLIGNISLCHTFISHSIFIINICCVTVVHFLSKSEEEYIGCRHDFLKKAVFKDV